jgi:integrase
MTKSERTDRYSVPPNRCRPGVFRGHTVFGSEARADAITTSLDRADLFLFLLFTGLRSTDAATVRWDDIRFDKRTLHRPCPKGGEDKAFDVPLSDFLVELLQRRKQENPIAYGKRCSWVFPTLDRHGRVSHVSELKEAGQPSPHRLRDTFATAAHEAGVSLFDTKILMNHALPVGDITEGYMRPTMEHLAAQQERANDGRVFERH